MKHSCLLCIPLALLLGASTAQANDDDNSGKYHDRHGPDMERRMEHLSEELQLTSEQSEQLQAVMEAAAIEREAILEEFETQIKPQLCALHLDTQEQVREILSPEQAEELESRMERWAPGGGPGRHRGKGHPMQDCEPAG